MMTWSDMLIIAVMAAAPGIFICLSIIAYSYLTYPPMWWRRYWSRRITGSYQWRVYENR